MHNRVPERAEMGSKTYLKKLWLETPTERRRQIYREGSPGRPKQEPKPNRPTPRHHIIKMAKVREVSKKTTGLPFIREPQQDYQLISPQKLCRTGGECHGHYKVLKGNSLQPKILSSMRSPFRIEGKIKFLDKQKWKYHNIISNLKEIFL